MTVTNNRALTDLCHIVLVIFTVCSSLCYANVENLEYVDINGLPVVMPDNENSIPIVGVLSQEISKVVQAKYPHKNITNYIAASYVKYVEGAGGRVVPIW